MTNRGYLSRCNVFVRQIGRAQAIIKARLGEARSTILAIDLGVQSSN